MIGIDNLMRNMQRQQQPNSFILEHLMRPVCLCLCEWVLLEKTMPFIDEIKEALTESLTS